jgi:hypothetical protein
MYSVNLVEAIAEYPGDKHESDLRKDWHPFYQEPQLVYVLSCQLDCQRASASWQRPAFGCSSSSEMPTPHHNMYNFFRQERSSYKNDKPYCSLG